MMCCSSPLGSGLALAKRRNASSISRIGPRLSPCACDSLGALSPLPRSLCRFEVFRADFFRHRSGILSAMSDDNAQLEPTIFSAMITPHRSLGNVGFMVLMIVFGGVSFVAGMVFLLMGAWPVFGFFGLDVLLFYWAFRVNYRAAAAYEEVTVTPTELKVRKVEPPRRGARMGAQSALGQARPARATRNSASSGCSWCRAASNWRSPISSGPTRRRVSRRRSATRSARPSAGRRGR